MFVYMVQDDDTKLVKIGYSASPDRRIKDLNSLFSQPLPSADMPTDTTVKKRLHEVSRRFGISYQRVRSLWHMDARHVTAWEADRIRKITHALQIEQAEKYEAMAAQIKAKIASRNLKRSQPRDQLTMELIRDGE